jgi:hypothetical protein
MFSKDELVSDSGNFNEVTTLRLLIGENAPLKQVMGCSEFPDELALQRPYLVKYLQRKEIIHQLLGFMMRPDDPSIAPQSADCKFAFYAFSVLSTPNDSIIKTLLNNSDLLALMFSLAQSDENRYATAQGYLMGIIRVLLSDMNQLKEEFISVLFKNSGNLIFPLIHNMTSSNSTILKDILVAQNPLLRKLQFSIFEYILFFYLNEKFATSSHASVNEFMFDNLVSIFKNLGSQKVIYEYKLKYEGNLYTPKNIRAKDHLDDLFYLRVCILKYIAATEQIRKSDRIAELLASRRLYSGSRRKFMIVKEMISFVKILSVNKETIEIIDHGVIKELIGVILDFPKADILHSNIFDILMNCKVKIEVDTASMKVLLGFLASLAESSSLPGKPGTLSNKCSLAFCSNFLNAINEAMVSEYRSLELIHKLKEQFGKNYTKFEIYTNDNSISVDRSDLMVVLKNPMEMFKFSEALNDKKNNFLEVMPLISIDMIKSQESFRGSMILTENALNNKDLLQNELLHLENSLLNSIINTNTDEETPTMNDGTPKINRNNLLSMKDDGLGDDSLAEELCSPRNSKSPGKKQNRDRPLNLSKDNMLLLSNSFLNL